MTGFILLSLQKQEPATSRSSLSKLLRFVHFQTRAITTVIGPWTH